MNRNQKLIFGGLTALLILGAGASSIYYGVYIKQAETGIFRTIGGPLPVAKVDGKAISYNDYLFHLKAGQTFLNSPIAQQEGIPAEAFNQIRKSSLDRAIRIQTVENLSQEKGVKIEASDVDRAFEDLVNRSEETASSTGTVASSTPESLAANRAEAIGVMTQLFGWNEAEFKQYMVRPALLEDLVLQKLQDEGKTAEQAQQEIITRIENAKRYIKV